MIMSNLNKCPQAFKTRQSFDRTNKTNKFYNLHKAAIVGLSLPAGHPKPYELMMQISLRKL